MINYNRKRVKETEDGAYAELLFENEELRVALDDLVGDVLNDVPKEMITNNLGLALLSAQILLTDLGDIDHKETEDEN